MPTAAVKRHWDRIAQEPCMACGYQPVTIAHCHGPSLRERNPAFLKPKGKKMPWMHMLVIPLCWPCHCMMDNDPLMFTRLYGRQAELLDRLGAQLGLDLWALALAQMKPQFRVAA